MIIESAPELSTQASEHDLDDGSDSGY